MTLMYENDTVEPGIGNSGGCRLLPTRLLMLQRLITQLEEGASVNRRSSMLRPEMDSLSLLSRLRRAHARYALGSGPMERMGAGAWFRQTQ